MPTSYNPANLFGQDTDKSGVGARLLTFMGMLISDYRRQRHLIRRPTTTLWFCLGACCFLAFADVPIRAADRAPGKTPKTLERLKVGGTIFTNVTITDVTATHLFIKSPQGFANVRLSELEPSVKALFVREEAPPSTSGKAETPAEPIPLSAAARGTSTKPGAALTSVIPKRFLNAVSGVVRMTATMIGGCMVLFGWFWLVFVAFRVHLGWGAAVLIGSVSCGLLNLIFMVSHWEESKRPFFLYVGGFVVILLAVLMPPH